MRQQCALAHFFSHFQHICVKIGIFLRTFKYFSTANHQADHRKKAGLKLSVTSVSGPKSSVVEPDKASILRWAP